MSGIFGCYNTSLTPQPEGLQQHSPVQAAPRAAPRWVRVGARPGNAESVPQGRPRLCNAFSVVC